MKILELFLKFSEISINKNDKLYFKIIEEFF